MKDIEADTKGGFEIPVPREKIQEVGTVDLVVVGVVGVSCSVVAEVHSMEVDESAWDVRSRVVQQEIV